MAVYSHDQPQVEYFLIVAMERHQRRIAAEIAALRTDKEVD